MKFDTKTPSKYLLGSSTSMMSPMIIFTSADLDVALPDEVDAPPVARGHRRDEAAAACCWIEDAARLAKSLVDVPGILVQTACLLAWSTSRNR